MSESAVENPVVIDEAPAPEIGNVFFLLTFSLLDLFIRSNDGLNMSDITNHL